MHCRRRSGGGSLPEEGKGIITGGNRKRIVLGDDLVEIYSLDRHGETVKKERLTEALKIDGRKKQMIAFVGAGGKTTAIFELAYELAAEKKKVVITTSTHMYLPEKFGVLDESRDKIAEMLDEYGIAVAGIPCGGGKMRAVSGRLFAWVQQESDFVLVEADGSRGLPMKAPGPDEPVIPPGTGMVVIVAGMNSLGKPLKEVCHRPEIAAVILGCSMEHRVEMQDLAKLIKECYCKTTDLPCRIVLSHWEGKGSNPSQEEIARCLDGRNFILTALEVKKEQDI